MTKDKTMAKDDYQPIELGRRVSDCITGFVGIAVARTENLHGPVMITVQAERLGYQGGLLTEAFAEKRIAYAGDR